MLDDFVIGPALCRCSCHCLLVSLLCQVLWLLLAARFLSLWMVVSDVALMCSRRWLLAPKQYSLAGQCCMAWQSLGSRA